MGLSSSKSTTTSGPSKQALPYLTSGSSALQSTYNATQPNATAVSNSLFDRFNTYNDTAGADLAGTRGYVGDVLGGKYLTEGNPYLQGMIDQTNSSVADQVNALFSRSGQTGSSRQIGELGKQLANAENSLRYQNYSDEMGRMAQAAGLGLDLNNATNANEATAAALGTTAAEVPWIGANNLAGGLGGLWGNAQTTTTKQGGGLLGSLLGAGAQLGSAAIMASDRRLKDNITKLGEMPDGLGVYQFTYINPPSDALAALMPTLEGGDPFVGVMADEVAALRPWALGPQIDGFATVDYGKL